MVTRVSLYVAAPKSYIAPGLVLGENSLYPAFVSLCGKIPTGIEKKSEAAFPLSCVEKMQPINCSCSEDTEMQRPSRIHDGGVQCQPSVRSLPHCPTIASFWP